MMKRNVFSFFIIILIQFSTFANGPKKFAPSRSDNTSLLERYYPAIEAEGLIGSSDIAPLDSPKDNVFTIILEELPAADEEVWLTYDLYGISNHTGISRSINDQLSTGGYFVTLHRGWNIQEELLNSDWLQYGDNKIRFTLPENATYNYRIKNLGFRVKKKGSLDRAIIINQPTSQEYVKNLGYIKGFIQGKGSQEAQVYIDDAQIQTLSSEIEALIVKKSHKDSWESIIKAVFADGEVITKKIVFTNKTQAHYKNTIAVRSADYAIGNYTPKQEFELSVQGASISIDPDALANPQSISITALRDVDIPALDGTMVNVTKNHKGYRFLAHGTQLSKDATIVLDYDFDKIPDGYTAKDIRTFYFDDVTKRWVALKKQGINTETHQIMSKTSHFKDMINGIIKVPESPETAGYIPTSIKDIKAADPSAAINTIEPPSANNMGSANIGYPIVLPTGRQGMQPQLSIQYNSEGYNDWLGMGWNLTIPSISIETRWGVPRYDSALETETYTFEGRMLAPVAHRNALVARTSEKQFHPRVEGRYDRIIRHGDNPKNYWWEVTDKSGTRYSYGGTATLGIEETSVLRDADGNIAHWALLEVRDLNDNFMRYDCVNVQDVGVQGGTVSGQNIYLDRITYTCHGIEEGKYEVLLTRDRELGEPKRTDVSINARLGFKKVTADLLRKIEVRFDGRNIRSYELNYIEGAFNKTLLASVSEFDAADQFFNTHTFEYYDDVRNGGDYAPLADSEPWFPQNDEIEGTFITPDFSTPLGDFNDFASALSGNKSIGGGFGLAVTVGPFDGNLAMKTNTAGANFGFNIAGNDGLLAFVDINGDGLPDKVFKDGENLFFRPNQSGPSGITQFGPIQSIIGINDFSKGITFTGEIGLESHFVVFAGFQYSRSQSIISIYFSDVNGDQLIDIVKNGRVYFNHIDDNGFPNFTLSSGDTPSPISAGMGIDPNMVENDPAELEEAIANNPLHDVVKMWRAPYNGTISITGAVALIEDLSDEGQSYTAADGVRVAIQHKGTELWFTDIAANDFTSKIPSGVGAISVSKGDQIYFRVQSVFDGAYDQVNWAPRVTYTLHSAGLNDPNGLGVYQFKSDDDFLLSAPMSVGMAIEGSIRIEGNFIKPVTSDDISVSIVYERDDVFTTVWQQDYNWNQTVNQPISIDENVLEGDNYYFRVSSETNIDWTALEWNPYIFYTVSTDPVITQVYDSEGNPLLDFYPVVDFQSYNQTFFPSLSWEAPVSDTFTIKPQPILQFLTFESGDIVFTIKKNNELVHKQTIPVFLGFLGAISSETLILNAGDQLYFEYHTRDVPLANTIFSTNVTINSDPGGLENSPGGLHSILDDDFIYGPLYRHWGQFAYFGNGDNGTMPIDESKLELDDAITDTDPPSIDLSTAADADEMQSMYDAEGGTTPNQDEFIYMAPDNELKCWRGYDDLTYVKKDIISSSRMGQDDILPVNPIVVDVAGTGAGAVGVLRVGKTDNFTFSIGAGPLGASTSFGSTRQCYDFIDMNGDRYPDILSENKIQYTHPFGGLESEARDHTFGDVHRADHSADGFTAGGTFLKSSSSNSDDSPKGAKASNAQNSSEVSAGLSVLYNTSEDNTAFAWMDINGDGLPDRVHNGGLVELNIGYAFLPAEQWGYIGISDGISTSFGAGLSINISNYSISAGIGLSLSENETEKTLQDLNGDGLLDYIEKFSPLKVAINTGNGFAPPILWAGADAVSESASTGESANAAFTIGIPILPIFPVVKLCINPQVNISQGADRTSVQFDDINGDGFPDYLRSDKDDQMTVSRSTIQRTNKLKRVNRPLGANITLDYEHVGNDYDLPHAVWAMSSLDIYDGFVGDGADVMASAFEYEEGHYDRHERDFYGFALVKSDHLDTENGNVVYRTVIQEYINDNYYEKGLLKREIIQDADENLFTESINSYELKDVINGATLPESFKHNDADAAFVAETEMQKYYYEGQAISEKNSHMTYSYDVLGNVISHTDFGEETNDDDIISNIDYHNLPDKYIVDIPSQITVMGGGQSFRKRQTEIDEGNGNITQVRKFLENGEFSSCDMDYDIYGNIIRKARPKNANGERLIFVYEYDPEVNIYNTNITDSYGYSSSAEYDIRFGKMLLSTDLNGNQMRYVLDNVGRITSITGPLELEAGLPFTIAFDYHPEAEVPWASTKHYDPANPDNEILTTTFIDGLKRSLQVKKDASIFIALNTPDEEKMIVSGGIIYDAFGRTIESYYPVLEPKGSADKFNNELDGISPKSTTYDVLDRVLTVTLPDATVTSTEYSFGFDRDRKIQFSTKVTDANGIWKESYTNIRGLTKAVAEQYSQDPTNIDIWRSYNYNAINELIQVLDDQDNSTKSNYDWFGRRTEVSNPNAGTTVYEYDLANNLTQSITANLSASGTAITYTYDHERRTNITYPENPHNDVAYTYGDAGASDNRAGRIVLQEDATGAQEFFYNPLGVITKNIRTIIAPVGESVSYEFLTYTTQWEYDTWNRVMRMIYPDGEVLTYNYNFGGLLQNFSGIEDGVEYDYLTRLGYDKFEDRVYQSYGNRTETYYAYEPDRRRLKTMIAETATDRKMMDNVYTYDNVNNILQLKNNANVPTGNLMGGPTDYNYTYDDLYRLTNATGYHKGNTHENRYTLEMEYNSLHSIVKKDQLHEFKTNDETEWIPRNKTTYDYDYEYNNTQPHAPIQIGDKAYSYDANGNQTGWIQDVTGQDRKILWDEENRIRAIADNGEVFKYLYDAEGERIIKSNGGEQTVSTFGSDPDSYNIQANNTIYVNPYVVIRHEQLTKHYFIESQRIASKLTDGEDYLLQNTAGNNVRNSLSFDTRVKKLKDGIVNLYSDLGLEITNETEVTNANDNELLEESKDYGDFENINKSKGKGNDVKYFMFYYHPDHLGSSSYITDIFGEVIQHVEYFAFGETFLEEHNADRTPYLYNGKELDEETGLYYYGARYYDAKTSVWQSVDPLADHPNQVEKSPYAYSWNNPVYYTDPDGRIPPFWNPFIGGAFRGFIGRGFRGVATNEGARFANIERLVAKRARLKANQALGKAAERIVTNDLIKKFGFRNVSSQVTGRFEDNRAVRFDNVVAKNGKILLVSETKFGDAVLSAAQKRFFEKGEPVKLVGKKSEIIGVLGKFIDNSSVPISITRVKNKQ